MTRENDTPSLFRVLAGETLVEYTAAAAVAGAVVGVSYLLLPTDEVSALPMAFAWSALSLGLYLCYVFGTGSVRRLRRLLAQY